MLRKQIFLCSTIFLATNLAHADEAKTFVVQNGAFPWYDRIGKWMLDAVPSDLKGNTVVPQQNCASRILVVPDQTASIILAVSDGDGEKFRTLYPSAHPSEETLAVKSPEGDRISYRVFDFTNPPAKVGEGAKFGAGLILLKSVAKGESAANAGMNAGLAAGGALAPSVQPVLDNPASPLNGGTVVGNPQSSHAEVSKEDLPAKANFHLYLLMGQSNMVGRDTSGLAKQVDNPRILALNPAGKWVVAREPMHEGGTGIGPGISFAADMLKSNPTIKIGLVPCAVGGTPLKRWVKGADLYSRAVSRAKLAAQFGEIKGVLWHQGESNSDHEVDAAPHQTQLAQMFKDLRHDLDLPNLPIVVGQLGEFLPLQQHPYADVVRKAIIQVARTSPHIGLADSKGLKDKGDLLHFNAESQTEFGKRYAAEMLALQNQTAPN